MPDDHILDAISAAAKADSAELDRQRVAKLEAEVARLTKINKELWEAGREQGRWIECQKAAIKVCAEVRKILNVAYDMDERRTGLIDWNRVRIVNPKPFISYEEYHNDDASAYTAQVPVISGLKGVVEYLNALEKEGRSR